MLLRNLLNISIYLSAGEYSHESTQSISTKKTPMSPADLADLRRQTPKQQNSLTPKQPVFLCDIIQLCCIPLRDLRHLRENNHARVLKQFAQTKPQCLPQISQIIADKPQNHTNSNLSFSAR